MKFVAIIPARYASTRFPGKPLALLQRQTIIERVYQRVAKVIPDTYVATDDERIFQAVLDFGGKAIMTATTHQSGTDRCFEAFRKIGGDFDVIVNVQGDEPFIAASQIESLKSCFEHPSTEIATLVKPFSEDMGLAALSNPNSPKVLLDENNFAIYFSRAVIPYLRGHEPEEWLKLHTFYKHIGLYAYRASTLEKIVALPQSTLEKAECLEQLRWIEAGYKIKVSTTDIETIGIDTPEDLKKAELFLAEQA